MDELEKIHSRESQWEDCIAVKEKRVTALEAAEEKIAVLLAIARMWDEQVEEKDRGVSAYNRIIERAGISKGAMYYYFADKQDLFATVLNTLGVEYGKEMLTPVGRPMQLCEGTPIERLTPSVS